MDGTFPELYKLSLEAGIVRKQEIPKARKYKNKELVELMICRQQFVLLKKEIKSYE
ncbi:MAG: hypothetical protein KAJ79_01290 [Candidatus Omnitrophica bacterium]|nr:hypothetical protein [Candidatus Omnitrophota bacterium]MCK5287668.1 hypothetical protein [Candidatus Omnitrophota bacterium]